MLVVLRQECEEDKPGVSESSTLSSKRQHEDSEGMLLSKDKVIAVDPPTAMKVGRNVVRRISEEGV